MMSVYPLNPNIANFEEELIIHWLKNMENQEWQYQEPILDSETTAVLRYACTSLQQDVHVFVNSVEILEEYIRKKNNIGHKIENPILTLSAVVSISSKYKGEQDLKLKYIQDVLKKVTGKSYELRQLLLAEIEILNTVENKLFLESVVDDLTTLATKIEHELKIKASIVPLCLNVLEIMYILRKDWFFEFKDIYSINDEALYAFKKLICSRFFIPSAIVIYALEQTAYKNSLNINLIAEQLATLCKVHTDHLQGLIMKINDFIQKNS